MYYILFYETTQVSVYVRKDVSYGRIGLLSEHGKIRAHYSYIRYVRTPSQLSGLCGCTRLISVHGKTKEKTKETNKESKGRTATFF